MAQRLQKEVLKKIAYAILDEELGSYVLKRAVEFPGSITNRVDIVGYCGDAHSVVKKIFVQCSSEETLFLEEVETHIALRGDLKKLGFFKKNDEYWLINSGEINQDARDRAEESGITLKDDAWISETTNRLLPKSKKVKETVSALRTAGLL